MIAISTDALQRIEEHARQALPREACGFLVGRGGDSPAILRVVASANLAPQERTDRFEIDPRLHLRLQRELRDSGHAILGIYHSHPGGRAAPSATDKTQAAYPGWIWLITALDGDRACVTRAFRHIAGADFDSLPLEAVNEPAK